MAELEECVRRGEELVPLGRDPGLQDGPGLLAQRVKLPPQPPDS